MQNLEIDKEHIIQYAHYGYVYCMLLATNVYGYESNKQILISGGGDGTIKMWSLDEDDGGAISESSSLENGDESVLAMALDGTLLYSGRLDGDINVWDLDTRQLIRRVKADATDILTLAVGHGLVFTGSADGLIKVFLSVPSISARSVYKCSPRNSILGINVLRNGKLIMSSSLLRLLQALTEKKFMSLEETIIALPFGIFLTVPKTRKKPQRSVMVCHQY